jgi:hypothetical protein
MSVQTRDGAPQSDLLELVRTINDQIRKYRSSKST